MEYDRITYYKLEERGKRELLEQVRASLKKNPRIALACMFGSFLSRKSFRDLDVAIYAIPPLSFEELLDLSAKLELELGIPTDVVQLQDLDPTFRQKVLKRGFVLVSKTRQLHPKLVAQTFSEHQDLEILRGESSFGREKRG